MLLLKIMSMNLNQKNYLNRIYSYVDDAKTILQEGNLDDFGILLNEAWQTKKKLIKIYLIK